MKMIKTLVWFICAALSLQLVTRGAESVSDLFQKGLLEEEANRNLPAAIQAYEEVVKQIDSQRRLAATAIFRLGETYRKLGRTNDAIRSYERLLKDFPDESALSALSRQNLAGLGFTRTTDAASREAGAPASASSSAAIERQRALLKQEIELVFKQQKDIQKMIESGVAPKDSTLAAEREILQLKRQLEALGPDQVVGPRNETPAASVDLTDEDREIRRLTKLLENSPDLLNAPQDGLTPLQKAAQLGQVRVAEFLLKNGAGRDSAGSSNLSPLLLASEAGHKGVVDLLLAWGASVTAKGSGGLTPLHAASAAGHRLVVARLLEAKPEIDAVSAGGGSVGKILIGASLTPLAVAVERGHHSVVEQLITAGADVIGVISNAFPPLEVAIRAKQPSLVKRLLEAGAEVVAVRGRTPPLDYAVSLGEVESAKILTQKGASVTNSSGMPLVHLVLRNSAPDLNLLEILLDAGADPNSRDLTRAGIPALAAAFEVHNRLIKGSSDEPKRKLLRDMVVLLLGHHADLNVSISHDEMAAFRTLADSEDREFISTLLANGMDVNKSVSSERALHAPGIPEVFSSIADSPEGIFAGDTVLSLAVRRLQSTVVGFLLEKGANPNILNREGQSLLGEARQKLRRIRNPDDVRNRHGFPPSIPKPPASVVRMVQTSVQEDSDWVRRADLVVSLLEQHGAREDIINLREIRVARDSNSYVVFGGGTNNWNTFTYFELLACTYLRIAPPRVREQRANTGVIQGEFQGDYQFHPLRFPNLRDVVIRRALPNGERSEIRPNLENLALEWGDVVHIPEGLHVVGEVWKGLDEATQQKVFEKIRRKVTVTIGGKLTELLIERGPFGLRGLLATEAKLLTSSDPERIQIRRQGRDGGLTFRVNLKARGDESDVWLQDGDQVEVPDTRVNP